MGLSGEEIAHLLDQARSAKARARRLKDPVAALLAEAEIVQLEALQDEWRRQNEDRDDEA